MSLKESIGWTNMTRNPIKGRCKGGCWYCFYSGERGILNRFKHNPKRRLDLSVFDNLPKKPKKIFLCSTHDLFGSWIPYYWRDEIFLRVIKHPQHTFQILTKFPQNIDRPMLDNVWLGVTVEDWSARLRIVNLEKAKAKKKFVSFEPLFGPIASEILSFIEDDLDWVIVGRLTQYGDKYNPDKSWIETIVRKAKYYKKPIFIKDNLKEIWGENLIQEFPK